MSKRSQIKMPTPAEDTAINAAARQDTDAQPLTDAELAQFKHDSERQQYFAKADTVDIAMATWNDFNAKLVFSCNNIHY